MTRDPRLPPPPSPEALAATLPVPKAELHVHLEGTAPPDLVRELARRNAMALPDGMLHDEGTFAWTDFLHFLRTYDAAASCMRTAEDYREVTSAYLRACAASGAEYVELICSPDHAKAIGLPEAEHQAGIAAGIDLARAATGIEGRVLISALRHLGPERAEELVREAIALASPYVVGLNVAGDEAGYPAAPFSRAYALAHEAGLGCTCHAGEHAGPESIRGALELPGLTRLSHGVRAVEDPALVAELAEREVVLEVCPTSNVALGVYGSYEDHPLRTLHDAGVRVTLGSDDPPYFGASLHGEYALAHERLGFSLSELEGLTATARAAAFG